MIIAPILFRSPLLQTKKLSDIPNNEALARSFIKDARDKPGCKDPRRISYVQNLHYHFTSGCVFSTNILFIKYHRYVQNTHYKCDTLLAVRMKTPFLVSFYNTDTIWKPTDKLAFAVDNFPLIYDIKSHNIWENVNEWFKSMIGKVARLDVLVTKLDLNNPDASTALTALQAVERERVRDKRTRERLGLTY